MKKVLQILQPASFQAATTQAVLPRVQGLRSPRTSANSDSSNSTTWRKTGGGAWVDIHGHPPPCFFMLHSKAHICVLPAPTVSVFGAPVSYPPCLPFPTPVCPCSRSDLHTWPGHGVTLSFQNFRKRKNLPQGSLSEGLNVA